MSRGDPVDLLTGFVRRFGAEYVSAGGEVDESRLADRLEDLAAGDGGVVHVFDAQGVSVLTGLSYQTSTEQVLNAVVSGLAVDVRSGLRRVASSGPLAELVSRRAAELDDDEFASRAAVAVGALPEVLTGDRS